VVGDDGEVNPERAIEIRIRHLVCESRHGRIVNRAGVVAESVEVVAMHARNGEISVCRLWHKIEMFIC
jgi:hypothetical protein